MRNTQNDVKDNAVTKKARTAKRRFVVFGSIGLLFVAAMAASITLAGQPSEADVVRQKRNYSSEAELATISTSITKAFATLPQPHIITYTNAQDTCFRLIDGQRRLTCLRGGEHAQLGIDKKQTPLQSGDTVAATFEAAGWTRKHYNVTSNAGQKLERDAASSIPGNPIHVAYTSPNIEGKTYCAGFIYNPHDQPAWHGTLSQCQG